MNDLLQRLPCRWVHLAIVIAVVVLFVRLQDRLVHFDCYQRLDRWNFVVTTATGPGTWTRVTSVTETAASVTIGVSSLVAPLPAIGENRIYLTVHLRDPFADRTVIDAMTGLPVPSGPCGPPD